VAYNLCIYRHASISIIDEETMRQHFPLMRTTVSTGGH
jgi:hypothetical protein